MPRSARLFSELPFALNSIMIILGIRTLRLLNKAHHSDRFFLCSFLVFVDNSQQHKVAFAHP